MKLFPRLTRLADRLWQQIDPFSLRSRLTFGIAIVSIVGIGSVAIWTSWKMQQILVVSHKQSTQYIAERFARDVEFYREQLMMKSELQVVVDNLTTDEIHLWVTDPNGRIIAQSGALDPPATTPVVALMSMPEIPMMPKVYEVKGRYLVSCSGPLKVQGQLIGKLSIAKDITVNQHMLQRVIRSVTIASSLAIVAITVAIAIYIQRSLKPLRRISQMAGTISAEDLGEVRLRLGSAPTEVKELAQTCNLMLARLSESWEQQRQFVSNVSHELRTPLTLVSGYLQSTLRRSSNLTEPQREALTIAASETDRTISLMQELLSLARADSGHLHFQIETFVLKDLVVEVVEMAQQVSKRKIDLEAVSPFMKVQADRNYLKQVLINLVDNAMKYSEPETPVVLKLNQIGENVTIQVCDRGCGIPLQHQARIFERFYRVDRTRTRSTGGCGLGLAIVQTFVKGMGGTVTLRSSPDEGSTFTVTLPVPAAE